MSNFDTYYSRFVHENTYPRHLKSYRTTVSSDAVVFQGNKKLIDFSSNDYLGLAKHPFLIARSHEYAKLYGAGSSSSRLVRGNLIIYDQLEQQLATALGKESALILGAGFEANASLLEALLDERVFNQPPLIFCDKSCHASIYAGLQAAGKFHRFRHNNLDHLAFLLNKYKTHQQPLFIIVESIYSMDGDHSDLQQLSMLAQQSGALLYVDDAHAVGMYGNGWGKTTENNLQIDVVMGTFSKALGSFGSYFACSHSIRNYLIQRCKSLIYSTALPPPVLGAISAAIELLPTLETCRQQVIDYAEKIRKFLDNQQLFYGKSSTHIVPWIIGCAQKTRQAAQLLEKEGILGTAIQPPTVPLQQSRIRFCASALHTMEDLELLFSSIQKVREIIQI